MLTLKVWSEAWPIRGNFTISRGSKTQADVVVVELTEVLDGEVYVGRGECVPYPRYGESTESVIELINSMSDKTNGQMNAGLTRKSLQQALPAGAARNALDCAFWDLEAKRASLRVWTMLGVTACQSQTTAYTLSLDTPENMFLSAQKHADKKLLKLKLAGDGDLERVKAVRDGSPEARLIVDANEGWSIQQYESFIPALQECGVEMIEQPFPADNDMALSQLDRPIAICADESCHGVASLENIVGRYDMINIKLDKTGGLTEALALKQAAQEYDLQIMVGCMVATSLAMAPAMLVAQGADVVDLDGPLLLETDREHGLLYEQSLIHKPNYQLWG